MKGNRSFIVCMMLFTAAVVGAGCASTAPNPAVEEARVVYQKAQRDPQVVANAPVALEQAKEVLEEAERLWQANGDPAEIDNLAYIATQRVAIARERAKLNAAEEAIAQAEMQRTAVLLESRTNEAERRAREAELATLQADEAVARAQVLAAQIEELEARNTDRGLVLTLGDVLFDVNQAQLKSGGLRVVERLGQFLQAYPTRNILIEGHTDSTGAEGYNQQLSERRAATVRAALIARNISPLRIDIIGFGERYPVATNDTPAGRQENRRVEVVISDENGNIKQRAGSSSATY